MFPPHIPHVFIRWLTDAGDIVYDPFSGRGTTPMEACRLGRIGFGSDANPLAYILTGAKVNPPSQKEALDRIHILRKACCPGNPAEAPDDIQMLYHPIVLGQLLWLRDSLNSTDRTDRFLLALLLGIMHANYKPGRPARGLSISMPNTFSMAPGYVRRYIKDNGLIPPYIDVFDLMESKLARMHLPNEDGTRGHAWRQDVRDPFPKDLRNNPAKLVFTSPPYLSVIRYGKYNWIRLWMLKQDSKNVDQKLISTSSLRKYLAFMNVVLEQLKEAVRDDGYLCLIFGDVMEKSTGKITNLAECVWAEIASKLDWHRIAVIVDEVPSEHKVSRIWKHTRGQATKTDRILILGHQKTNKKKLPRLNPIEWSSSKNWA
jgi:site-specific DNA-methyltransferase (adenine-specific)